MKPEDVFNALDTAHGGPIEEGSVGGGTGMICYEFKGGTGTASRVRSKQERGRDYTVGVLVQANCGRRPQLMIAGVPVGKEIPGYGLSRRRPARSSSSSRPTRRSCPIS